MSEPTIPSPASSGALPTRAFAAQSPTSGLAPFQFERRRPGPHDALIRIRYCGVCHTDIHFVRNDWGISIYPMVPGHEIVGVVAEVGAKVGKFKPGDTVGVGCLVDSCRACDNCGAGLQQYCTNGMVLTYSAYERDGKTVTYRTDPHGRHQRRVRAHGKKRREIPVRDRYGDVVRQWAD